jgi:hypothetical protein
VERRGAMPVRVAGIDAWSWRKGTTYGTIVVNLERRDWSMCRCTACGNDRPMTYRPMRADGD